MRFVALMAALFACACHTSEHQAPKATSPHHATDVTHGQRPVAVPQQPDHAEAQKPASKTGKPCVDIGFVPRDLKEIAEPKRIIDHLCLIMDLDYMRAPLFEVEVGPGESLEATTVLPGRPVPHGTTNDRTQLVQHQLVLGSRVVAGQRCVYAIGPHGALHAGFVPANDLQRLPDASQFEESLPEGRWFDGTCGGPSCGPDCPADTVVVSSKNQAVHVKGSTIYGCDQDGGASGWGDFDGDVRAHGSCWRGEGKDPECILQLVHRGPFLMVESTEACADPNARFAGIYLPMPKQSAAGK